MLILCLDIIYFPCQVQVPKHLKNIYLNQAKPIYWANSKHMKKVPTRQRFNLIIHYLPNLVAMVRHWSLITRVIIVHCTSEQECVTRFVKWLQGDVTAWGGQRGHHNMPQMPAANNCWDRGGNLMSETRWRPEQHSLHWWRHDGWSIWSAWII